MKTSFTREFYINFPIREINNIYQLFHKGNNAEREIQTMHAEGRCHQMTLKQYIRFKIKILQRDFKLILTEEQIDHMKSLTSEIQVDNYARKLLDF